MLIAAKYHRRIIYCSPVQHRLMIGDKEHELPWQRRKILGILSRLHRTYIYDWSMHGFPSAEQLYWADKGNTSAFVMVLGL